MSTISATKVYEVMQAFERGERIEYNVKDGGPENWSVASNPSWNWDRYYFRIASTKPTVVAEAPKSGEFVVVWGHDSVIITGRFKWDNGELLRLEGGRWTANHTLEHLRNPVYLVNK